MIDTHQRPALARIDVNDGDPKALAQWRTQVKDNRAVPRATTSSEATHEADTFASWLLVSRLLLNAGSAGAPICHLAFKPPYDLDAQWWSGDLIQIRLADDAERLRDYSIASIASHGLVELLLRQEQHPDGTLGATSGLLTSTLSIGDTVELRLRPHTRFRLEANARRAVIFIGIGNGHGLAGLRSHLRARASTREADRPTQIDVAQTAPAACDNC